MDDGQQGIGYYVAGVKGFDPSNDDTLCGPAWWPKGRYFVSEALDVVKELENEADELELKAGEFLGYAGQLGAALIVSRFAASGLEKGRQIVVGFDSGDYAVVKGARS